MLAQCLAKSLGYRCIDRDVVVESAAAHGVSQDELRDALEKPPTFLDRLQHKKYLYLVLIQAALVNEVRTGMAVYHGHAGHLLLKGSPRMLRVRIIAPLEFRMSLARKRLKMTRDEAMAYIQRMDQDRKKWTQYLYGVDWANPVNYDVVLNLEHVSIPDACAALTALVRQPSFEFTAADQETMDDLVLASQLRAEIALHPATSHLEVEIEALRGAVSIHGRISSVSETEEVMQVVEAKPGVTSVKLDNLAVMTRA